jgi:hypothetical protein
MLKRERTLEDGAVANTLPLAETPMPTSRKSSPNAFTISRGGPTLPEFWAAAGTAATTPAVSKTLTAILVLVAINPTIACRL